MNVLVSDAAPSVPADGADVQTWRLVPTCNDCSAEVADRPCRWPAACRRGILGGPAWQCVGSPSAVLCSRSEVGGMDPLMGERTPGPWRVVQDGWGLRVECDRGGWIIAAHDEAEANHPDFTLIAAAPDLLAACEAALEQVDLADHFGCAKDCWAWLAAHAVEKARGS